MDVVNIEEPAIGDMKAGNQVTNQSYYDVEEVEQQKLKDSSLKN